MEVKPYKYKAGDQPLHGYTIRHAAGRGGFSEVYFAESDSGKEVALKAIQSNELIELRGHQHCMNLKSPHLVSIIDLKHNKHGDAFAIMEFVAGPSLQDLLNDAAQYGQKGIGPDKARYFVTETAKGLAILHDSGIVHRDLKPSNIFFDQGYVKIGDYGLSKLMSESQHSAQTVTVGTVQYMAPEIGQGLYNRSIDIYALGVMLYEMLTGEVPFSGKTPVEVMMRHLSETVDLSHFDEPFKTVLEKSMAKDPAGRFQTIQAMAACFGAEPDMLDTVSQYAEQVQVRKQEALASKHGKNMFMLPPMNSEPSMRGAARRDAAARQPDIKGGVLDKKQPYATSYQSFGEDSLHLNRPRKQKHYPFKPVNVDGGVIRFHMPCPHCDHVMYIPRAIKGQIAMCPNCELGTTVPEPPPIKMIGDDSKHNVRCGNCNYRLNGVREKNCPNCGQRFDFNHYKEASLALPSGAVTVSVAVALFFLVLTVLS